MLPDLCFSDWSSPLCSGVLLKGKEIKPFSSYPMDAKRESFWNTTCSVRRKDKMHEEERLKGEIWEEIQNVFAREQMMV